MRAACVEYVLNLKTFHVEDGKSYGNTRIRNPAAAQDALPELLAQWLV